MRSNGAKWERVPQDGRGGGALVPPGALQLSSLGAGLGLGTWLPSGPCVQPTEGSPWPDGSGWLQGDPQVG